jgi:hypothetical protein
MLKQDRDEGVEGYRVSAHNIPHYTMTGEGGREVTSNVEQKEDNLVTFLVSVTFPGSL